jgi:GH25 family lysozyme M1 (1,4-beta-N-acetylmuramidase)
MFVFLAVLGWSSLNGVDVSSYQADLDATAIPADFLLIKATEGTSYVNPYCDKHYQQALSSGKKVGVYHFARNDAGTSPYDEANWFVQNCLGYIKTAILVLDWEESVSDVGWANAWLNAVLSQTGVHPVIYMSYGVTFDYDWSSVVDGNFGLWVAYWAGGAQQCPSIPISGPSVGWWSFYAIWQWTDQGYYSGYSGTLDCDEFEGDVNAWDAYARN